MKFKDPNLILIIRKKNAGCSLMKNLPHSLPALNFIVITFIFIYNLIAVKIKHSAWLKTNELGNVIEIVGTKMYFLEFVAIKARDYKMSGNRNN